MSEGFASTRSSFLAAKPRHSFLAYQTSWLSVYGISARKRARLTAVDS